MKKYRIPLLLGLALLAVVCLVALSGGKKQTPPPQAAAAAPAAAPASGTGGSPAGIIGVNIADQAVLMRQTPLLVTFAEPMAAEAALNKALKPEDAPFVLKPETAGEGRWLTDKVFAFMAAENYLPATEYTLYFKDDLKSLDGRPARYMFSFRTAAVELLRVEPGAYDPESFTLALHLNFNRPVSKKLLAAHLEVADAAGGEVLETEFSQTEGLSLVQTVQVQLGVYRPELALRLKADKAGDKERLGLARDYALNLKLPEQSGGVTRIAGSGDEPSPVSFDNAYDFQMEKDRMGARFNLSEALADETQKEFVTVTPALPFTLEDGLTAIVFREKVEPGAEITVTLKPGLTDATGRTLKEDRSTFLLVGDMSPAVGFSEPGHFLSPLFGGRVALDLVNVDQVTVTLLRQYDNNLPFMDFDPGYREMELMRRLTFKEIPLTGLTRNRLERRALDLDALTKGKKGVYVLSVTGQTKHSDAQGRVYYGWASDEQRLVVLTDIGVSARLFPSGITVLATGISGGNALPDATVKVYSRSNQLIARGFTDQDGIFVHSRSEPWDEQLKPHIVTVEYGDGDNRDLTFLPLTYDTALAEENPSVLSYLESGYEAFVYTPRGVFRPGETVNVKAFVRNVDHNPPQPFPVLFRVQSSRALEAAKGSATLSEQGGADFSFVVPASAPTGHYTAQVLIPGDEKKVLGECVFQVEDFVPPRLELDLKTAAESLTGGDTLSLDLAARYLFGAPGAGLNYEVGYRAVSEPFEPDGWKGYSFGNAEQRFGPESDLRHLTGNLPDSGEQTLAFSPPDSWAEASRPLGVMLVGAVQEDGGRWVNRTASFRYFATPYLLGLKPEAENFEPGKEVNVAVAAVSPQGEAAQAGPLTAEVSLIQGNWQTVFRNNRYVYTYNERFIPKEHFDLASEGGKAELAFTPEGQGQYLVRVASAEGGIVATCRVNVYGADGEALGEGTGRMDKVELSLDKKEYREGETAKLTVKAPFAGTLLLGIERGTQLSTRVVSLDEPGAVLDIPVTKGMDPNVTITASVIRPVRAENREWYSHRAFGTTALIMSKAPYSLQVSASAPARALPAKPLEVPFTVTDEQGAPVEGEFSVALIDEGILSLTGFATPSPVDFFLGRRASVGRSYDAFDLLLRPEAKATPLLAPGGGMAMAAAKAAGYQGSLSAQQIFLAEYVAVAHTDANGQGKALFNVPEYSGKGRLMIVGASGGRFASGEAQVRFARDIVVEASAPRAVAPGDEFDVAIRLFAESGAQAPLGGEATVSVTVDGPLSLVGDTQKTIALDGGRSASGQAGAAADQEQTAPPKTGAETGAKAGAEDGAEAGAEPQAPAAEAAVDKEPEKTAQAGPMSHDLTVRATAAQQEGAANIVVAVSVPGREDLSFSKEVALVVRPPFPRSSRSDSALILPGGKADLALPGEWLPGSISLSLSVSPSPVASLLSSLEYLRVYPYDCLEQTVSKGWPLLAAPWLKAALNAEGGGDDPLGEANSAVRLAEAVAKVSSMQVTSGGFGFWPGNTSASPWRSVYATWFLIEAKARTPVATQTLDRAFDYLRFVLAVPDESLNDEVHASTVKAFAAFVLTRAGQAPLGWLQHLAEREETMLPSGRIFLAGARALMAGNAEALQALDRDKALAGKEPAPGYHLSLESELRNKALLLYFWSQVEPGAKRAAGLCQDIAKQLTDRPWFTTQESGLAAMAFGAYLEKSGIKAGEYSVTIASGGKELAAMAEGKPVTLTGNDLPGPGPDGALPDVTVSLEGKGSGYAVYSVRGTPRTAPEPASNGLIVSRVWKDAAGKVIDLAQGRAVLKKGERVLVELTLAAEDRVTDIALSDLLPGGLEVENPRLNTAAGALAEGGEDGDGADGLHLDLRDDRLLLFYDSLHGKTTYSYALRAVSRGTFVLPPLAADAMYEPEINAVTPAGVVVVE